MEQPSNQCRSGKLQYDQVEIIAMIPSCIQTSHSGPIPAATNYGFLMCIQLQLQWYTKSETQNHAEIRSHTTIQGGIS